MTVQRYKRPPKYYIQCDYKDCTITTASADTSGYLPIEILNMGWCIRAEEGIIKHYCPGHSLLLGIITRAVIH